VSCTVAILFRGTLSSKRLPNAQGFVMKFYGRFLTQQGVPHIFGFEGNKAAFCQATFMIFYDIHMLDRQKMFLGRFQWFRVENPLQRYVC
jgi:hypothetical protein